MDPIETLIERGDQLFSKRGNVLNLWQEIAENFYPERADFTMKRTPGDDFAEDLSSSYPLLVRRELGDSFSGMLRPREEEWFAVSVDRAESLAQQSKAFLERMTGVQRRATYDRQSQFVRATKEGDHDFASFGQCVISVERDRKANTLLYRNWHLRDTVWTERYNGTHGTVHRKWRPTLIDLKGLFPKTIAPKHTERCEKAPFDTCEIRHIVVPTEDHEILTPGLKIDPKKFPYVSIFLDIENKHVLEEIGSRRKIYVIPRWKTISGSQYAVSPATIIALPDARLLQAMTQTLLDAGEMAVRPPMLATKEAIRSDVQIFAGGITWLDAEYDERLGEALRPLTQDKSGLPFGIELSNLTKDTLTKAFYLNKLSLPPPEQGMTAFETGQRVQQYIRDALPLFEPMELEYNYALCEETFSELMNSGAFGPLNDLPQELRGEEIRFTFESPLHEAIERQKGSKFMEAREMVAVAAELDPSAIAIFDAGTALRDALGGIRTPQEWLRSEEAVEQAAAQQAAHAQAQQLAQTVAGSAEAAKSVGDAAHALGAAA